MDADPLSQRQIAFLARALSIRQWRVIVTAVNPARSDAPPETSRRRVSHRDADLRLGFGFSALFRLAHSRFPRSVAHRVLQVFLSGRYL